MVKSLRDRIGRREAGLGFIGREQVGDKVGGMQ